MRAPRGDLHRASPQVPEQLLRRRFAAYVATGLTVSIALVAFLVLTLTERPPARLILGAVAEDGAVIINNVRPTSVPLRVLDRGGKVLKSADVRYSMLSERASSRPASSIVVSPRGVVSCTQRADVTVEARLGALSTRFTLRCRPVSKIRAQIWNDFLIGDPPRELPADFIGLDGRPVEQLAGATVVEDTSVATMSGTRIRPVAPGRTFVRITVGNQYSGGAVRVFERVKTFEGLRETQRHVAAPVRLTSGDSVAFALPVGTFSVVFPADESHGHALNRPRPNLTVSGPLMCLPRLSPRVYDSSCLVRGPGAMLMVTHPGATMWPVVGAIAIARNRER